MIKIFELARKQKDIESYLADNSPIVFEHIAKLYMYPNNECTNHWRTEVYSNLHKIEKLRYNKKFPSKEKIFEYSFEDNEHIIRCLFDDIKLQEYEYEIKRKDYNELKEVIKNYFLWLSDELSEHGAVTKENIYKELVSLGL